MLTQVMADELMNMVKRCVDATAIQFPLAGTAQQIEVKSKDNRESFLIDVNRKGRIRLAKSKCTYQERYAIIEILLRLDVGGPPHENPDGVIIPCPHLHTYREGFGTKWAQPLPSDFTNSNDLEKTLSEFLSFCNVEIVPSIQRSLPI